MFSSRRRDRPRPEKVNEINTDEIFGRDNHSIEGIGFLFHEAWMAEVFALTNKPKEAVELCQKIRELNTESGQSSGDNHMHRACKRRSKIAAVAGAVENRGTPTNSPWKEE